MAIAGSYAQVAYVLSSFTIAATSFTMFGQRALAQGKFSFQSVFVDFIHSTTRSAPENAMLLMFSASVAFVFGYSIVAAGRTGLKRADP
jgi:hypothetical protein